MSDEVELRLDVAGMAMAERMIGRKSSEIIAEIQSDTGMGVRTLHVLFAVGLATVERDENPQWRRLIEMSGIDPARPKLGEAAEIIEEIGINAAVDLVAEAVTLFLDSVTKPARAMEEATDG